MEQYLTDLLDIQSVTFGVTAFWALLTILLVWFTWRTVSGGPWAKEPESKTKKIKSKDPKQRKAAKLSAEEEKSLAVLLSSLDLPPELQILSQSTNADHIAYSATGKTEAAEIGTAFADELERIGFEITPIDNTHAKAIGEAGTLELAIAPKAGALLEDGKKKFPYIKDDSVVVEVWLGDESK